MKWTRALADIPSCFWARHGDDVQTIKAGIMEIADIFVINKRTAKEPSG